jgi:hypothetical protein
MGAMFVKQPNGLLARFHTGSDQFTHWDLTETEAVEVIVEEAREDAVRFIGRVMRGETRATWDECVDDALSVHRKDPELKQVIADANRPARSRQD